MKSLFIFALQIILLAGPVMAADILVRQDGTGDHTTITAAVAAAVTGDRLVIGAGTYSEPTITIDTDLTLMPEGASRSVIMHGEDQRRLLIFTAGCRVEVRGLVLTHANFNDGAAVHVENQAQVDFIDCMLRDNYATHVGGAAYVRHPGSRLAFTECDFVNNYAPLNAGAVGISLSSSCHFFGCRFEGNTSETMAGAIANYANALMEVVDCTFTGNKGGQGGAIRLMSAPGIIEGCTFSINDSTDGTIYLNSSDLAIIRNNIIVGETTGHGLHCAGYGSILLDCNLFHGNESGDVYGLTPGDSNLFVDPLLCDPELGDLRLCDLSPAAPGNNSCGLIGAWEVGCVDCGPVATEKTSLDRLKSYYR